MNQFFRVHLSPILILLLAVGCFISFYICYNSFQTLQVQLNNLEGKLAQSQQETIAKETNGLLLDRFLHYGRIDSAQKTVSVSIGVLPSVPAENTTINLMCDEETIPLSWDGQYYQTTIDVSLNSNQTITSITIVHGDDVAQATVDWKLINYLSFTPQFHAFADGHGSMLSLASQGEFRGSILCTLSAFDMEDLFYPNMDNITGSIIKVVNGVDMEETPVVWKKSGNQYEANVNYSLPLINGTIQQSDIAYVFCLTSQENITYRFTALMFNQKNMNSEDSLLDRFAVGHQVQVYGLDGSYLYSVLIP